MYLFWTTHSFRSFHSTGPGVTHQGGRPNNGELLGLTVLSRVTGPDFPRHSLPHRSSQHAGHFVRVPLSLLELQTGQESVIQIVVNLSA